LPQQTASYSGDIMRPLLLPAGSSCKPARPGREYKRAAVPAAIKTARPSAPARLAQPAGVWPISCQDLLDLVDSLHGGARHQPRAGAASGRLQR
jgi:hypothetical protein